VETDRDSSGGNFAPVSRQVCDRRVVETRHPLGFEPPRWTGVSGSIPTRKAQRRRGEATRVAVVEESRFAGNRAGKG